jgi:predicted ester cyclase
MSISISAQARLLRGFAVDFLTCHDLTAVTRIMDPVYCLNIGGHVFDGRDNHYLPATAAQLEQFPGLCVTVHDVVLGPEAVAMRFTEHGVSRKHGGRAAAWGGVTLFRLQNGLLRQGWAEEDYFARKRQLATGACDSVKAPHAAPWDVPCVLPDATTEVIARRWLQNPAAVLGGQSIDEISAEGPRCADLIAPTDINLGALFSAGDRAAFHLDCHGTYAGGFDEIDRARIGREVVLRIAGLMTVRNGEVFAVQIAADRLGLYRQLS